MCQQGFPLGLRRSSTSQSTSRHSSDHLISICVVIAADCGPTLRTDARHSDDDQNYTIHQTSRPSSRKTCLHEPIEARRPRAHLSVKQYPASPSPSRLAAGVRGGTPAPTARSPTHYRPPCTVLEWVGISYIVSKRYRESNGIPRKTTLVRLEMRRQDRGKANSTPKIKYGNQNARSGRWDKS